MATPRTAALLSSRPTLPVMWFGLLPVLAASVAYFNSFQGVFQFDDYNVIVDNSRVHSWGGFLAGIAGIRPLLKATYTLNWISGLGVTGFHLINLFLHLANTALIQRLSARLFCSAMGLEKAEAAKAAMFVALLFALHPIQTESVTYICGRSMSLMAIFYLGAIAAYDYGRMTQSRIWTKPLSCALFILAIASKEIAITLPVALLLWEVTVYPGEFSWRHAMMAQAMHLAILAAFLVILFAHPGYSFLLAYGFNERSLYHNVLSQLNGIHYLACHVIFPGNLNFDPDLPTVTRWSADIAIKAGALGAMLWIAAMSRRRRPLITFSVMWFFVILLPSNSIIPRIDIANDRHMYLACWGIFLLAGWLVVSFWREYPGASKMVLIILPLALGAATYNRNELFKSEIALWEDTVSKSPEKPRAHNNLGYAYALAGRFGDAKKSYSQALKLNPDYKIARANLRATVE